MKQECASTNKNLWWSKLCLISKYMSVFADNLTPEYVLRTKLACVTEFVYFDIFWSRLQTNAIVLEPGQMASAEHGLQGRQPEIAMKKECKQKHTG